MALLRNLAILHTQVFRAVKISNELYLMMSVLIILCPVRNVKVIVHLDFREN